MATRYRIGHHRAKRSFHVKGVLFVTVFVMSIVAAMVYFLSKEQFTATETKANVTSIENPNGENKEFTQTYFTIGLPEDWKLESFQEAPTIQYIYKSTKRFADNRSLIVYVDTIRAADPLSHLIPVEANGDKLTLGNMSDRCTTFAGESGAKQNIPAKWSGVNFICGGSFVTDYIVGTSSILSGVNQVEPTGPTTGKHTFFFVYNDQNINPDATIFQEALRSFRAK